MIRKKTTTIYQTGGREFTRLEDAVTYRENQVEAFLRKAPGFAFTGPIEGALSSIRDRIAFVRHVLDNRRELIRLLDYDDKFEEGDDG